MKKQWIGLLTGVFLLGMSPTAEAELIMYDSNTFFKDTDTGWFWYTDVAEFVNNTWAGANTNIGLLDTAPSMVWEMATGTDLEALFANRNLSISQMFSRTGEYYDYWYPSYQDGVYTDGWVASLGSAAPFIANGVEIVYYETVKLGHDLEYLYTNDHGRQGQTYTGDRGAYAVFKAGSTFQLPATMLPDGTEADPVPEPATMLLFGTGLVGLVGSRLRKKKK